MKEKKELPLVIFKNEPAIKDEKKNLENLVEVIGEFSAELEKDSIALDDELLDQFVQNGTTAITNRLVENADSSKSMNMLMDQLHAGARRTASRYEIFWRKLDSAIHKARRPHTAIVMLNGQPSVRGNILDEITEKHTIAIDDEKDLELYEKLTGFATQFNELKTWIKENHPEMEGLTRQTTIALCEHFLDGDEIASGADYLINKPNEARDDVSLMVNPLYFG